MKNKIFRYILICAIVFGISVAFDLISGHRETSSILKEAAVFSIGFTVLWGLIVERMQKKREQEKNENSEESCDIPDSNS